ncbi:putative ferric-chelate reductase 1 homolog [Eurytemora carolleeae]|uniref:putative ferric-chelate reductase 1 homolog n=1 Tax=Eurytemora carolleeae TaxID=1294199 RepID=UPI000C78EE6B|nr:putative ferric-chelate reductase 1 homolog [Eurytemora carolleeae]|eukprot:XP_023349675.1 putative ferric-chelate reductase 1 homolog [Eurytemora affinis]
MREMMFSLLGLLIGGVFLSINGYNMGAPDAACSGMTPGHSRTPQVGEAPAKVIVNKSLLKPGDIVDLVLHGGKGKTFKGFIIQARDAAKIEEQVGSFVAEDDAKYMTCGRGIHNSLTHRFYMYLPGYKTITTTVIVIVKDDVASPDDGPKEPMSTEVLLEEELNVDLLEEIEETVGNEILETEVGEITSIEDDNEKHLHPKEDFKDLVQNLDLPQPSQKAELPLNLAAAQDQVAPVDSFTPIYISSTTTLSTSTTTETPYADPLPIIGGILQHTDPKDPIFNDCNTTKACFGIPDNCVSSGKCQAVVAYYPDKLQFHFEMKALSAGYVAFGLSRDGKMGEDLTTNCLLQDNGNVDITTGYNYGKQKNGLPLGLKRDEDGISERLTSGRKDGWITCSWRRTRSIVVESEIWDLEKDKYHIMLALGDVQDYQLQYHNAKTISGSPMGLGQVGLIQAKSRLYIMVHGSFMIGAWICAASVGIMIARYFKQTWTSGQMCGVDQWFIWHRILMVLVWSLSIVGLVLIIIEVDGLTPTVFTNPHAIMGFITVGLAFLQPFIALLRCSPVHRHRWIFNWIHWIIGNGAHALGIITIFFAVDLDKALLPRPETDYLLIAWVAFHFVTHFLLSCFACASDSKAAKSASMHPKYGGRYNGQAGYNPRHTGMYPDYEELKRDTPGSWVRVFTLVMYMLINCIVSAALILLVVMAPTRPILINIGILKQ